MCVDSSPEQTPNIDTDRAPDPGSTMVKPLSQKVALVTSSAPGLCADTAKQLAQAGAKVVVCGRDATQGLATVREIRTGGGRATFVLADIAVTADVQGVIDETIATYGRLDILFNNVSNSYARDSLLTDVSESVWDRLVEPLLKGTFFCCQYALPFLQQSSGTIINLVEQEPDSLNDSVSSICQGGVLALTGVIAHQFSSSSATSNVIWAAPFSDTSGKLPVSTDINILLSQVLTEPSIGNSTGRTLQQEVEPFHSIAEAVMYLACYGTNLHGVALLVNP